MDPPNKLPAWSTPSISKARTVSRGGSKGKERTKAKAEVNPPRYPQPPESGSPQTDSAQSEALGWFGETGNTLRKGTHTWVRHSSASGPQMTMANFSPGNRLSVASPMVPCLTDLSTDQPACPILRDAVCLRKFGSKEQATAATLGPPFTSKPKTPPKSPTERFADTPKGVYRSINAKKHGFGRTDLFGACPLTMTHPGLILTH